MTWKFHVHATAERRLFSRILQVLESQMVMIHSFVGDVDHDDVRVRFVLSSEQDRVYRIEALLYRLESVRSVTVARE
jgi:hypothetical protein